ncbi:MAG: DNA gyrase subunit A [Candidatus Berkelbacteria bacterium]|nr:DNA gyrase subunit A [Candidatus Berkelbacteria bacterium]
MTEENKKQEEEKEPTEGDMETPAEETVPDENAKKPSENMPEEILEADLNFPDQKEFKYHKTDFGDVAPQSIVEEIEKSYLDYAMSVIVARALPDARDGLKPVHRRIIYSMGEMGLTASAKFTKSAKIVGEVLGKYHPHGDIAVYDTIVGMAQDFKMNHTLVNGQGNFGSLDGDPAAASRYTEAKMSKITEEMLADIDKNTVLYTPNYDSTLTEPVVLPTKVPNLLVNGTVGIAVGMATNIPPHNLGELCDGINHLIDNPQSTIDELMQFVKGPDFPTYGTIHGAEGIKNAFATGHGKIIIRGEAEIIEDKRGFQIIISSIPFQVNKSDLISKIANLVKEKKLEGLTDIRDESDREKSVRIVIELKATAYPKKVLNRLYDLTQLQTAFHINMLALVDRIQPRILTLKAALLEFINHRKDVIKRRTQYDLDRARERAHILEGLKKALDHIDKIIELIKKSENREAALKNLVKTFEFSKIQANAILDMRLSALAALERQKVEDELKEKLKQIEDLIAILKDANRVVTIIKDETKEIKDKYAVERRTKIISQEIDSFQAEDLIPNESVIVTLTKGNYVKRVSIDAYKKQGRGGKGIIGITPKEEDQVIQMETASTHDTIYFFTNLGKVFVNKVYEIPASSRQARGHAIVNFIQISPEENVTAILIIPSKQDIKNNFFLMGTKQGVIKKTRIESYSNIRKSGLIAIKLKDKDELAFIKISSGNDFILMISKNGKGILFSEDEVRPMGRSASGVIGIRLKTEDEVISMASFIKDNEMAAKFELLTVLENGLGKRTQVLKNFPLQRRGGYGVIASKNSQKTGKVVEALITVNISQDLILASKNGQVIRIPMKSAKLLGRDTQGVRLMKLAAKDTLASVSMVTDEIEEQAIAQIEKPEEEILEQAKSKLDVKYYTDGKQRENKN